MVETLLNLVGLGFTAYGAFVAAKAVILSEEQADRLSEAQYDGNKSLRQSLLYQSRSASVGLWCVVIGTGLQAAALIIQLFR